MKRLYFLFAVLPLMSFAQDATLTSRLSGEGYTLHYDATDTQAVRIQAYAGMGIKELEGFFGKKFKNQVNIYLFKTREQLDKQWQNAWGIPGFKSECWMVGSGLASRLDLLSPAAWKEQACEHDPNDQVEIKRLVYHELTHVLHSDFNRSREFDDINNIDWFVEGLATYASGQLDEGRYGDMAQYVKQTGGPGALSEFWKGQHKYGLSGSIVSYIDRVYGRALLSRLLEYNDVKDILSDLKLTEEQLIEAWKASVLGN